MDNAETTTRISILGEEFQVRGAEQDLILQVASLVDERFRALQASRPTMDVKRLAVMVCLNMAEELTRERAAHQGLLRSTRERVHRCLDFLEEASGTP
jgi:cell division protein ZapA (FtsZ GTPase activity inhibitor)